jgi:WD40 repeat protein
MLKSCLLVLLVLALPNGLPAQDEDDLDSPRRLAVSTDGKTLAAVARDKRVRVWDVETGKLRYSLELDRPGKSVALRPMGDTVIAGTIGDRSDAREPVRSHLYAWLLTGKSPKLLWKVLQDGSAEAIAIDPKTRRVAAATPYGNLHLFDLKTGAFQRVLLDPGNGIRDLAVAPDGKSILTAGQELRLWNPLAVPFPEMPLPQGTKATDEESQKFLIERHGFASYVAMAPNGKYAAAMSGYNSGTGRTSTLVRLEMPGAKPIKPLKKGLENVTSLAISPDGERIAVGYGAPKIEIRTGDTDTLVRTIDLGRSFGDVRSMAFLDGGKRIAVVSRHGTNVEIRSVADGTLVRKFTD